MSSTRLQPISVWVVAGSLGAGKTTVLSRWLAAKPAEENWVVLLNEFTEAGIDALTVAAAARGRFDIRLVPGGCLGCSGEADFRRSLQELVTHVRPDRILIEPSGIGHPGEIVDELLAYQAAQQLRLEAVIGLIDPPMLEVARSGAADETLRAVIEIADVLLLSKSDLASPSQHAAFVDLVAQCYPPKRASAAIRDGALDPVASWLAPRAIERFIDERPGSPPVQPPIATHEHAPANAAAEFVSVGPGGRREVSHLGYSGAEWRFPRSACFSEDRLLARLAGLRPTRLKAVLRVEEDRWLLLQSAGGRVQLAPSAWRRDQRIEVQFAPQSAWDVNEWDRLWLASLEPRPAEADRSMLHRWYTTAVAGVHGAEVLARYGRRETPGWVFERGSRRVQLELPDRHRGGRLRVLGVGKAASALLEGFVHSIGADEIDEVLLVSKPGHADRDRLQALGLAHLECMEGDHPFAGARSLAAGQRVLQWIGTPSSADRFVVLLTGGASALLAAAAPGVSFAEKQARIEALMRTGAPIAELNRLRTSLSAIKGGRLAARMAPATVVTLAISDVEGDDPRIIGSGPTFTEHTREDHYAVIATLDDALERLEAEIEANGWRVISRGRSLYGEVSELAASCADALKTLTGPCVFVAGGEPTVQLRGQGRGGRAQQFALQLALALEGRVDVTVLVAGTDGTDGPTEAAGAIVDGTTAVRIRAAGFDPEASLRENDAGPALEAAGDLLVTGPTGTNVADVVIAIVRGSVAPAAR